MGILICGLNGTGKSTLGKELAEALGYRFIDNEDLYFPKEDENYEFSDPRSKGEVIRLLEEEIATDDRFVFAAVKGDYGDKLLGSLTHVVLIEVPGKERLRRVRERSSERFGDRILPGGDLFDRENRWFSIVENRPEDYVTGWLETIRCPVIKVDGTLAAAQNVTYILNSMKERNRNE